MTAPLTLLAWMCTSYPAASYVLGKDRLHLDRRPRSRYDRQVIAMFTALLPVVRRFPGDRVAIRREVVQHHDRWLHAVDLCLAIPDWWMQRTDPVELCTLIAECRYVDWRLPDAAVVHPIAPDAPRLRQEAA